MGKQLRSSIELNDNICANIPKLKEYACNTHKTVDSTTHSPMCNLGDGKFIFAENNDFNIIIDDYLEYYQLDENYHKYTKINPTYGDCLIILHDQDLESTKKEQNIEDDFYFNLFILPIIGLSILMIINLCRDDEKLGVE